MQDLIVIGNYRKYESQGIQNMQNKKIRKMKEA